MTSRQSYEAVLIELHKENAPNLMLEDFNYLINKAINLYVNKRYNIYDINQLTTDDLRVLKATAILDATPCTKYDGLTQTNDNATYEVILPSDYLHILNCICIYDVNKTYKCYDKGKQWRAAATRLTADAYSQVLDNFWNKPSYKRPYYYIHNVNTNSEVPTNPYDALSKTGTDFPKNVPSSGEDAFVLNADRMSPSTPTSAEGGSIEGIVILKTNPEDTNEIGWVRKKDGQTYSWVPLTSESTNSIYGNINGVYFKLNTEEHKWDSVSNIIKVIPMPETEDVSDITHYSGKVFSNSDSTTDFWGNPIVDNSEVDIFTLQSGTSNIERSAGTRYGNASQVRMEIRYGTDRSIFELKLVYIDYIKAPQNIRLTQEQLDYTEDRSQVLEWPDYVCQEIINELVHIVMENISDLRIQTHPVVSLSIANPAQQLTQPQQ